MANVGVNVPVPEVIGYMGSLYAENIVLAEWMLDPDKVGVALSRTWMYQEMAFGPLDREAMGVLFERLRGLGRAVGEIPMVPNPHAGETLQPDEVRRSEQEDMAKVKSDLVLLEENIHNTAKDYFNANDKHIDMDYGQKATMFDDAMIEFKRSIKLAKSKFGVIDTKMDDIK